MKFLIRSSRDSFRRAGRQFTREGVVVDAADLAEGDLEAILAEPNLGVTRITEEGEEVDLTKGAKAAAKGGKSDKSGK